MYVEKKVKEVKEVETVVDSYNLCDKCNERIETDAYDAFEFNIEQITGKRYSDSASAEKKSIELCPKCADDCMELLKTNGYRVITSDWSY